VGPGAEQVGVADYAHRDLRPAGRARLPPQDGKLCLWPVGLDGRSTPLPRDPATTPDAVWPGSDSLCRRGGRLGQHPDPREAVSQGVIHLAVRPRQEKARPQARASSPRGDATHHFRVDRPPPQSAASNGPGHRVVAKLLPGCVCSPLMRRRWACPGIAEQQRWQVVRPAHSQLAAGATLFQEPLRLAGRPASPARRSAGPVTLRATKGRGDSSGVRHGLRHQKPTASAHAGLVCQQKARNGLHVLKTRFRRPISVSACLRSSQGARVIGALLRSDQCRWRRKARSCSGWMPEASSTHRPAGPVDRHCPQPRHSWASSRRGELIRAETPSPGPTAASASARGSASTISLAGPGGSEPRTAAIAASSPPPPRQVVFLEAWRRHARPRR